MCLLPVEIIKPINWLIGKWVSKCAKGKFPTIESFEYCEEMEFIFSGKQPILNFQSRTWFPADMKPMHYERGFLRAKPGTNQVSFMLAHNRGLTSLEEGETCGCSMKLKSTNVALMSFFKDPGVCQLERQYTMLAGGQLEMVICMATTKTPLTEHLRVIYDKDPKC